MTDVESLSASLVREYLSRKGFKRSLRVLDEECPRTEESIRNRVVLAKELKIEKIMRLNKELGTPLRTMIEVMVKYSIEERPGRKPQKIDETSGRKSSLTTSTGLSNVRESRSPQPDKEFDLELEKALRITGEDTNMMKSPKTGRNRSSLDRTHDSSNSLIFGDDSRTQSSGIDTKNRGKDSALLRSNELSLDPVLDKPNKMRGKGQIQSTTDVARKGRKKKNIDLIPNGEVFGRDTDNGLSSSLADLRIERDFYKDIGQKKQTSKDMTPISRRKSKDSDILGQRRQTELSPLNSKVKSKSADIMVFDDLDDEFPDGEERLNFEVPASRSITQLYSDCQPITLEIATNLKNLIFGSASTCFNPEWRNQSFSFCNLPNLEFGIVQKKGGPCGVLAAVQATLLKHLLFERGSERRIKRQLSTSAKDRTAALADAISEMLWRAGTKKSAVLAVPAIKAKFIGGGRYKSDGITETLSIHSFDEMENLKLFVTQNIGQFESENVNGCVLFMYSLILSRGIKRIQSDMDEATGTLIGAHGYCTQELVNLCLTGKSVSNVFDRTIELDSGGTSKSILKGIDKQSEIGLLSLFEHYRSCTVGENYKSPKFPIWVVCSESHFSNLFSTDRLAPDRNTHGRFDLNYYDGLARQEEEIKLTIDLENEFDAYNDDLIPPLEHCIRTKWKNASVDWNHTEPIL